MKKALQYSARNNLYNEPKEDMTFFSQIITLIYTQSVRRKSAQ